MKNKNLETCRNCDYFVKHYEKGIAYFTGIYECGHCKNNVPQKDVIERLNNNSPCEYFEPIHLRKKKRKEAVKKVIRRICEKLEEIEQILKEDD